MLKGPNSLGYDSGSMKQRSSKAEAEAELGTQDLMRASEVHDSAIDVSQRGRVSEQDRDWLRDGIDYGDKKHGVDGYSRDKTQHVGAANDFWLPQVDASGQVYLMYASQGSLSYTSSRFSMSTPRPARNLEICRQSLVMKVKVQIWLHFRSPMYHVL